MIKYAENERESFFLPFGGHNLERHIQPETQNEIVLKNLFFDSILKFNEVHGFNYERYFDCLYYGEREENPYLDIIEWLKEKYQKTDVVNFSTLINQHLNNFIKNIVEAAFYDRTTIQKEQFETSYKTVAQILFYLLCNEFSVKLFTTNHDLLLEKILNYFGLSEYFSDGFELDESPFSYEDSSNPSNIKYPIIPYFANKFCYYNTIHKLHGSFDYYTYRMGSIWNYYVVKIVPGLTIPYIFKEGESGFDFINHYSLYLTGEFAKGEFIEGFPNYFQYQYNNLKQALNESSYLVIVGYSFNDEYLNNVITKYANQDCKITLVSPDSDEISRRTEGIDIKSFEALKVLQDVHLGHFKEYII